MKPTRVFVAGGILILFVTILPLSAAVFYRSTLTSALKIPLSLSRDVAQGALDLFYFHRNAQEVRNLKQQLSESELGNLRYGELLLENERLTQLLELRQIYPKDSELPSIFSRVIGRSSLAFSRVLLIDKGLKHGIHSQQAVLAGKSLIGKIVETGHSVSKVLLITDPNCKIGALIQRTRQQGVIYGTASGECRMKYIPIDAEIKQGDVVETAGHGGLMPKGLVVGTVEKVWKEKGQIYQVALVRPLTDLNRIEEVTVLGPRVDA